MEITGTCGSETAEEREKRLYDEQRAAWAEGLKRRAKVPARYIEAEPHNPEVIGWIGDGMPVGLLLYGPVGVGKTYEAAGVVNRQARGARFVNVGDLLDECRPSNASEGRLAVINKYAAYDLLVLDDMGKEAPTNWSLETLFRLIDRRMAENVPTIITTNYSARNLAKRLTVDGDDATMAQALLSRLGSFRRVAIIGEDRRLNVSL